MTSIQKGGERMNDLAKQEVPTIGKTRVHASAVAYGSFYGVKYEIRCWSFAALWEKSDDEDLNEERWNFYLYLNENQFNGERWRKLWLDPAPQSWGDGVGYDYYGSELIGAIDWHGDCTYYEKLGGLDGKPQIVKIGCDYVHHFDRGQKYTLRDVRLDVERAILSLHEAVPELRVWCSGNGGYYPKAEGEFRPNGDFYSHFCTACNEDRERNR